MNLQNNPLSGRLPDFYSIGMDGCKLLQIINWRINSCNEGELITLNFQSIQCWNNTNPSKKMSMETLRKARKKLITGRVISQPVAKNVYFVNPLIIK